MAVNYDEGLALVDQGRQALGKEAWKFDLLLDIQAGVVGGICCTMGYNATDDETRRLEAHARHLLGPICEQAGIVLQIELPHAVTHYLKRRQ